MSGPYFANAGIFLVRTLFDLYILAVMLRFLFQLFRADFYNPLSQFLVRITNPLLRPLRRVIPGVAGVDAASIVLLVLLKLIELWLITAMAGVRLSGGSFLVLAIAGLLQTLIYVFFFAILIQVVLSWVAPGTYNYLTSLLDTLTEPVLRPARRLLPPMGGLDFSPLVVLIGLQLLLMLLVAPLLDLGRGLLH